MNELQPFVTADTARRFDQGVMAGLRATRQAEEEAKARRAHTAALIALALPVIIAMPARMAKATALMGGAFHAYQAVADLTAPSDRWRPAW